MERFLIGVWDMIEAGVPPSDAVTCDLAEHMHYRMEKFLGVRSLKDLDRMPEDSLRRLLGSTAIAA